MHFFQDEDYVQTYSEEQVIEQQEYVAEEELEEVADTQSPPNESEEVLQKSWNIKNKTYFRQNFQFGINPWHCFSQYSYCESSYKEKLWPYANF